MQKTMSVYDLLMPDKRIAIVIWTFVIAGFLIRQILRNQVEKGEELSDSRLLCPKILYFCYSSSLKGLIVWCFIALVTQNLNVLFGVVLSHWYYFSFLTLLCVWHYMTVVSCMQDPMIICVHFPTMIFQWSKLLLLMKLWSICPVVWNILSMFFKGRS